MKRRGRSVKGQGTKIPRHSISISLILCLCQGATVWERDKCWWKWCEIKKRTRRLAVVVLSHYCHHNSVIAQNHRLFRRKCERITLTSLLDVNKSGSQVKVSKVKVTLSEEMRNVKEKWKGVIIALHSAILIWWDWHKTTNKGKVFYYYSIFFNCTWRCT